MSAHVEYADLVGAWRLVSVTARTSGGGTVTPESQGTLLYTPDGWMSATIVTGGEATACYAGRVRTEGDEVVHEVATGLAAFGPGSELRRTVRFDGPDRLVLAAQHPRVAELTWERAG